ncbi:MAG TPA: HAMP domain-containing sensor histidine kinase [Verrucomicrobiae bacterium]
MQKRRRYALPKGVQFALFVVATSLYQLPGEWGHINDSNTISGFSVALDITTIRLVGADKTTAQIFKEAVQTSFLKAKLHHHINLARLPISPEPTPHEVIVLAGDSVIEGKNMTKEVSSIGLPLWAIVVIGEGEQTDHVEVIDSAKIDVARVVQALRSVSLRYQLMHENARLRGDLLTMVGRVNHDLKTPLNGVLAAGEAMREVLHERDPAAAAMANGLFNSVEEMVRLMNRVSFMLKATLKGQPLKPVPMGDVVWTVLQRMEGKIQTKGLKLTKPQEWPPVNGVEAWLEVVWGNLISNVLQHADKATCIELGWSDNDGEYVFFVGDNGGGVNPRRRASIIRRFELLHTTETGNGMGLPIVQRLVGLHGGCVSYEAIEEGGSRFLFTLPKCSNEQGQFR